MAQLPPIPLPFWLESRQTFRRPITLFLLALGVLTFCAYWLDRLSLRVPVQPSADEGRPKGVLLVSAYFPLSKSKHSQGEFQTWLAHFLGRIECEVYMFAPPSLADTVTTLRGPELPITLDTRYESAFDIEPLRSRRGQLERMHELDREKGYHSPELYAVWAAKPFFVNEALRRISDADKKYKYVFWVDAGGFRGPDPIVKWPYVPRLDAVFRDGARKSGTREEELVLIALQWAPPPWTRNWNESAGPIDIDLSEGSFFGGHPQAVRWWYRAYFTYFAHYADRGMFVGKDQTLMNSLLFLFRDRIINVWYNDPDAPNRRLIGVLGDCSGWWYYYFFWLASPSEQHAQANAWYEGKFGRCRVARVVSFADVLRRTFGRWWVGPTPTLPLIGET
ncbi:hypothetical protein EXIGLDRAFT_843512 [Exidia glandulosa HHB12029]|uniref:Uncharacterized protein n=1 Tax=Exidia glandulosa HHB12029 TaxID=1314781 RepID=A0A165CL41_EXIGL|nr:hypothetical protein EXIGLDRAFT_843512 [Exidia glandulosa HHB12029]